MTASDEKRKSGWNLTAVAALICLAGVASCKSTDVPANEGEPGGANLSFRKPVEPSKPPAAQNDSPGAISSTSDSSTTVVPLAAHYNNLAGELGVQGKYAEEEAAYRKAIELDPKFARAYSGLGAALIEQGKHVEAEAACRRAIELNPKDEKGYNNLSTALGGQGKWSESEGAIRKAIDLDPKNATRHYNLGVALREQGKFAEAAESFRRAGELRGGAP